MNKILYNGVALPQLGLGTFKADGDDLYQAVLCALNAGYCHIDTAQMYRNEAIIGQAIKDSGIDRQQIFITSKVQNKNQGYQSTLQAVQDSCTALGVEYIDLYLIHWPKTYQKTKETWQALEELYLAGKIRAIGVSNFQIHHLNDLFSYCKIKPMANQVELHPGLQQIQMQEFCSKHNIVLISYGPFMKGEVFNNQTLAKIAEENHCSIANVVINWGLQRGLVMIPKSVTPERIKDNLKIFPLSNEQMALVRQCNIARRVYSDPDNIDF